MKLFVKSLAVIFAAVCLAAIVGGQNAALADGEWSYADTDDGVMITAYHGSDTELTIPSSIDGKTVTALRQQVFYGADQLVSVIVPAGVKTIGNAAFYQCTALESVTFLGDAEIEGPPQFPGYGRRIMDRLNEMCEKIPYGGRSFRV